MHRKLAPALLIALFVPSVRAPCDPPVLKRSEIVFMYASTPEAYKAYGATFVAWGGAETPEKVKMHRDLGIRSTGSVWCLTAGAKELHDSALLREAVAIDIEGKPIAVPWLFDHVYQGQKTEFGNTNHPAFREHVKSEVRRVMAAGADGLHVDDHLGVASPAHWYGGGFDEYSLAGFRDYLKRKAPGEKLEAAGVSNLETFDYRELVRRHAKTREEVNRKAGEIPLFDLWKSFHLEAAADFIVELRRAAAEAAGHSVLLSANACLGNDAHHFVVPRLTHVVCEVWFNADRGTEALDGALKAYAAARSLGRPLACTASGHDWAHVKSRGAEELARFWVALTYAHGERFMVPHPSRQWCFNEKLGTHWYEAPIEEYAPVFRFIRENASLLDDFEQADGVKVTAPASVISTARRKGRCTVVHVVNRDYDAGADRMREGTNLKIGIPAAQAEGCAQVRLIRLGVDPVSVPVERKGDEAVAVLPSLSLWGLLVFEAASPGLQKEPAAPGGAAGP